jgi:hypothetical protein
MAKLKAKGQRGSWFAEVQGESLACVHQHWLTGTWYHDPNMRDGVPPWPEFIAAIRRERRVILTKDAVLGADETIGFERQGYIAVFGVDEITTDGRDLRFRLVERLQELE